MAAFQVLSYYLASQLWLPYEPFKPYRDRVRRDGVNPFTSSPIQQHCG